METVTPSLPSVPGDLSADAREAGRSGRLRLPGPFRGVCFDLDGLLVDTEPIWEDAKRVLFQAHAVPYDHADHTAVFGASEAQSVRYFTHRLGLPPEAAPEVGVEYLTIVERLLRGSIPVRPGAIELIASLRGRVPIALATNTRRSLAEVILEHSGLAGSFDAIATGDEVPPKPAPDVYLTACRRLGVAPADAVGLEDSTVGVTAVKAAGLTCIAVPSDPAVEVTAADIVLASLHELIED
ncbi:MAG: HAD family phosphatase [Chloroflexi bacterium]|nr:HAD family phosphatase [Chloroflexota bacterium]